MQKSVVGLLLLSVLASCTSMTTITSTDPQAKIYVDGEFRGTGSATHEDKKIVGSTTNVTMKKDGCRPQNFSFSRSEEFSPGACAGGMFTLVPFLWVMSYKPSRTYEFQCEKM
ncbi:MAG TPA: hypothetical protein VNJ01_12150 [Bacteriovoracaceae bacterium]|nr:hypothetical protein [Bacteriovoracaceae bacterium]